VCYNEKKRLITRKRLIMGRWGGSITGRRGIDNGEGGINNREGRRSITGKKRDQ
jgi:hypothetical protein